MTKNLKNNLKKSENIFSLFKDIEARKVSTDIEEDIKYLLLGKKVRYAFFWAGLACLCIYSYDSVIKNLSSSMEKSALIQSGTSPFFALFETDFKSKNVEILKAFDLDKQVLNEKINLLRNVNGETTKIDFKSFLATISKSDLDSLIKSNFDFKEIYKYKIYLDLVSSNESILLNGNEYKILEVIEKLSTLDEQTKQDALQIPLKEIHSKDAFSKLEKDELKKYILALSLEKHPRVFLNLSFNDETTLLKKLKDDILNGIFDFQISYAGADTKSYKLENIKLALENMFKKYEDNKVFELEKAKRNKVDLEKAINEIKIIQEKRVAFMDAYSKTNVSNYLEQREILKNIGKGL